MTRINMGIHPSELCDQHLRAEYRELPRMVAFSHSVKKVPDVPFTLGTGHMKSCVQYGKELQGRAMFLRDEMLRRGFSANYSVFTRDDYREGCWGQPSFSWLWTARHLLICRIYSRLSTMKRQPTWTNAERPAWSII